jgi:hypothetical protein
MKLPHITFLALVITFVATLAQAQQPDWIPQGIERLGQNASSRTEFTLDHSMLVFASKLDQDDEDLRRVIAGVDGVSVHIYRFPKPGMYDSEALSSVREGYHAAGWKHLVSTHDKDGGSGATDLWIRFENKAIRNVAVLFAGKKQLDLIAVSGSISPLDLVHLGGHFGIPKIEGGVIIPVPGIDR